MSDRIDDAVPAAAADEIVVSAVPAVLPKYVVTSSAAGVELARDKFDLNLAGARDKFARRTMQAKYPDRKPKEWPAEVLAAVRERLAHLARVPQGDPAATPPPAASGVTESGYADLGGHTYHLRTKLANFVARIVGETVLDDGVEQNRELTVVAKLPDGPGVTVGVPVERFAGMEWVAERLGPRHVIQAGQGVRDKLRCAIQEMSGDIPTATVYRHTGWREVGGRWHYLHAGCSGGVSARLEGATAHFVLPDPPSGDELRETVLASLGVLGGLAPDRIAFPLLATAYRAAVGGGANYTLWIVGGTGTHKSELAAIAQRHFGVGMSAGALPGNWSSTANALEELAFTAKDALLVIDDFAPPASRHDADRLHQMADRLIRGQGNGAGRQRMRADGSLRQPRPPRGLILGTGEDVPRGHSILARLFVVDVREGEVDRARLSECQRDAAAGLYAAAMAGFVAWLAPQYGNRLAGLPTQRAELRDRYLSTGGHSRIPDVIANLLIGLHYLRRFAEHVGAIDRTASDDLWERGRTALLAVGEDQRDRLAAFDPTDRFFDLLNSAISGGFGHVALRSSGEPPDRLATWGWDNTTKTGKGLKIGWLGGGHQLWLDQEATYAALVQLLARQGLTFPLSKDQLFRSLKDNGALVGCDPRRTTCRRMIEGATRPVSVVPFHLLSREVCKERIGYEEAEEQPDMADEPH